MKEYKVCIDYGRKCAAFEVSLMAHNEASAIKQAQVLARGCGFDAAIKKVTVKVYK